jgi:aminoglycoside phosphotransferase (APT) family kinase protein
MNDNAHNFDVNVLCDYLQKHIDGFRGPLTAKKFSDGQSNPTFLLSAASGNYVLRRQPSGILLKSAHAVDREFRVQRALADTAVPVARMLHLCEDTAIIGSMFYVMSYEQGRIFWNPALPDIEREQRAAFYDELIRILAALHNVDIDKVHLRDYGRAGNYYERQLGVWSKQYRASETRRIEAMEFLLPWLRQHCPADGSIDNNKNVTLVHGDYRIDNVMFRSDAARGLAVLDWELSTLGHPLADLAFFCMCLRLPSDADIVGLGNQDRDALGIPNEKIIVRRYCELRGIDAIENWHFYLAFSFFRLAAILQGVYKRGLDGNASSARAENLGRMVEPLAKTAIDIIRGDN